MGGPEGYSSRYHGVGSFSREQLVGECGTHALAVEDDAVDRARSPARPGRGSSCAASDSSRWRANRANARTRTRRSTRSRAPRPSETDGRQEARRHKRPRPRNRDRRPRPDCSATRCGTRAPSRSIRDRCRRAAMANSFKSTESRSAHCRTAFRLTAPRAGRSSRIADAGASSVLPLDPPPGRGRDRRGAQAVVLEIVQAP